MDVTFDGRRQHIASTLAAGAAVRVLLGLHVARVRQRPALDAGGFHHLQQEHLARAKQIADHFYAGHQLVGDDRQSSLYVLAVFLGVRVAAFGDAIDKHVL